MVTDQKKKASSIKLAGMLLSLSLTTIHWAQNNSCAWLNIINSRYEYIAMVFRENKFPKKTYLHRDKLSRQTLTYLHHSQQQPSCTYTKTILNDKNNNTSFQFTLWNYRHYIWSSVSPFLSNTMQSNNNTSILRYSLRSIVLPRTNFATKDPLNE